MRGRLDRSPASQFHLRLCLNRNTIFILESTHSFFLLHYGHTFRKSVLKGKEERRKVRKLSCYRAVAIEVFFPILSREKSSIVFDTFEATFVHQESLQFCFKQKMSFFHISRNRFWSQIFSRLWFLLPEPCTNWFWNSESIPNRRGFHCT